jgi:hypothetical protein
MSVCEKHLLVTGTFLLDIIDPPMLMDEAFTVTRLRQVIVDTGFPELGIKLDNNKPTTDFFNSITRPKYSISGSA